MKIVINSLLLILSLHPALAQIKWSKEPIPHDTLWNNYSTTFLGSLDSKKPLLVAAIPNNGNYSNFGANAAIDIEFEGSSYRFRSQLSSHSRQKAQYLFTNDSGAVYFLAPGIYPSNAAQYAFRVLLNGDSVLLDWSGISSFTDFTLNTFPKGFAFLGGYRCSWGNFISVELKRKTDDTAFAVSMVKWSETRPRIQTIFSQKNMNHFFSLLQRKWDDPEGKGYRPDSLQLPAEENALVFYLDASIYRKEAVEYRLFQNGKLIRDWAPNEYDNGFIWLKELPPGKFDLELRYAQQRHMTTHCQFEIRTPWQQSTLFRTLLGSLLAAFIGFLVLLVRNRKQQTKLKRVEWERKGLQMRMQGILSQLNPHFIFNALSSIQSLVNRQQHEKANEYLTAFSHLLRQSINHQEQEWIPVSKERDWLELYLKLEQLRFGFSFRINVEEGLESTEIPSLLLQPLVENAVKHGVGAMGEKGMVSVSFQSMNRSLQVRVEDNGAGFETRGSKQGLGLSLTARRIALFNESENGQSITMNIESETGKGTVIILHFNHFLN